MKKYFDVVLVALLLLFVFFSPPFIFDSKAVFALLSPGQHTAYFDLVFFLSFLFCRLAVIFCFPAYVFFRFASLFYATFQKSFK